MTDKRREKIIICNKCKGWGYLSKTVYPTNNSGDSYFQKDKCNKCEGTGRLMRLSHTTKLDAQEGIWKQDEK